MRKLKIYYVNTWDQVGLEDKPSKYSIAVVRVDDLKKVIGKEMFNKLIYKKK